MHDIFRKINIMTKINVAIYFQKEACEMKLKQKKGLRTKKKYIYNFFSSPSSYLFFFFVIDLK